LDAEIVRVNTACERELLSKQEHEQEQRLRLDEERLCESQARDAEERSIYTNRVKTLQASLNHRAEACQTRLATLKADLEE